MNLPGVASVVVWLLACAPLHASAAVIQISPQDCIRLARHIPAGDVAFQPGVDVHGKPVKPADLDADQGVRLPDAIDLEISLDLADRLGRRDAVGQRALLPAAVKALLGVITVRGDEAFWNGEKIGDRERAEVAAACQLSVGKGEPILPQKKPASGSN